MASRRALRKESNMTQEISQELRDQVNEIVERIGLDDAKVISTYATLITLNEVDKDNAIMIGSILKTLDLETVEISSKTAQELSRQYQAKNYVLDGDGQADTFTFTLKKIADNPIKTDEDMFMELLRALSGE